MSCKPTYRNIRYNSLEELKSKTGLNVLNSKQIAENIKQRFEAIDNIFNEYPKLKEIFNGDKFKYNQYLNSIFPDSKVKDIVYHGITIKLKEKFDKFSKEFIKSGQGRYGEDGFFFSENKEEVNKNYNNSGLITAIINLKNTSGDIYKNTWKETVEYLTEPQEIYGGKTDLDYLSEGYRAVAWYKEGNWKKQIERLKEDGWKIEETSNSYIKLGKISSQEKTYFSHLKKSLEKGTLPFNVNNSVEAIEKAKEQGLDGLIYENVLEESSVDKHNQYVVFEPEQIHIIGSKEDIQKAKEFVQGKKSNEQSETKAGEQNDIKDKEEKTEITYESILNDLAAKHKEKPFKSQSDFSNAFRNAFTKAIIDGKLTREEASKIYLQWIKNMYKKGYPSFRPSDINAIRKAFGQAKLEKKELETEFQKAESKAEKTEKQIKEEQKKRELESRQKTLSSLKTSAKYIALLEWFRSTGKERLKGKIEKTNKKYEYNFILSKGKKSEKVKVYIIPDKIKDGLTQEEINKLETGTIDVEIMVNDPVEGQPFVVKNSAGKLSFQYTPNGPLYHSELRVMIGNRYVGNVEQLSRSEQNIDGELRDILNVLEKSIRAPKGKLKKTIENIDEQIKKIDERIKKKKKDGSGTLPMNVPFDSDLFSKYLLKVIKEVLVQFQKLFKESERREVIEKALENVSSYIDTNVPKELKRDAISIATDFFSTYLSVDSDLLQIEETIDSIHNAPELLEAETIDEEIKAFRGRAYDQDNHKIMEKKVSHLYMGNNPDGSDAIILDDEGRIMTTEQKRNAIYEFVHSLDSDADLKNKFKNMKGYIELGNYIAQHSEESIVSLYNVFRSAYKRPFFHLINTGNGKWKINQSNKATDVYSLLRQFKQLLKEKIADNDGKIKEDYKKIKDEYNLKYTNYTKDWNKKTKDEKLKIASLVINLQAETLQRLTGIAKQHWIDYNELYYFSKGVKKTYSSLEEMFADIERTPMQVQLLNPAYMTWNSFYDKVVYGITDKANDVEKNKIKEQFGEFIANIAVKKIKGIELTDEEQNQFNENVRHNQKELDLAISILKQKSQLLSMARRSVKMNQDASLNYESVTGKKKSGVSQASHLSEAINRLSQYNGNEQRFKLWIQGKLILNEWIETFKNKKPVIAYIEGIKNDITKRALDSGKFTENDLMIIQLTSFLNSSNILGDSDNYLQLFDQQADKDAKPFIEAKRYTIEEAKALLKKMKGLEDLPTESQIEKEAKEVWLPLIYSNLKTLNYVTAENAEQTAMDIAYNFAVNKAMISEYIQPKRYDSNKDAVNHTSLVDITKRKTDASGIMLNKSILQKMLGRTHFRVVSIPDPTAVYEVLGLKKLLGKRGKNDSVLPMDITDGTEFILDTTADAMTAASGKILNFKKTYKFNASEIQPDRSRLLLKGNAIALTEDFVKWSEENGNSTIRKIYEYMKKNQIDILAFDSAAKKQNYKKRNNKNVKWSKATNYGSVSLNSIKNLNVDTLQFDSLYMQLDLQYGDKPNMRAMVKQLNYQLLKLKTGDKIIKIINSILIEQAEKIHDNFIKLTEEEKIEWLLNELPDTSGNYYFKRYLNEEGATLNNPKIRIMYDAIIANKINEEAQKLFFPGGILTQMTSLGFDLKPMIKDDKGKLVPGECYLPEGYSDKYKVGDYVFVIRVPITGLHSIVLQKIKGFLPTSLGNTIIQDEISVKIGGSDFDGDQRYVYGKVIDRNGKIETSGINGKLNTIFKMLENEFLEEENQREIKMPIDTEHIDMHIDEYKKKDEKLNPYMISSISKMMKNNQDGQTAISILARSTAIYLYARKVGFSLARYYYDQIKREYKRVSLAFKFPGSDRIYDSFTPSNKDESLLIDFIAQNNINHATDNPKDQRLEHIGITEATANVWAMLNYLGVPAKEIIEFMHSDVVQDYINLFRNSKSPNSKEIFRSEIYRELESRYGYVKPDNPKDIMTFQKKGELGSVIKKSYYKSNSNKNKLDVLWFFEYLNEIASDAIHIDKVIKMNENAIKRYAEYELAKRAKEKLDNKKLKIDTNNFSSSDYLSVARKVLAITNEQFKDHVMRTTTAIEIKQRLVKIFTSATKKDGYNDYEYMLNEDQLQAIEHGLTAWMLHQAFMINKNDDYKTVVNEFFQEFESKSDSERFILSMKNDIDDAKYTLLEILYYNEETKQYELNNELRRQPFEVADLKRYQEAFSKLPDYIKEAIVKYHIQKFGYGLKTENIGGFAMIFDAETDVMIGKAFEKVKSFIDNNTEISDEIFEQIIKNYPVLVPELKMVYKNAGNMLIPLNKDETEMTHSEVPEYAIGNEKINGQNKRIIYKKVTKTVRIKAGKTNEVKEIQRTGYEQESTRKENETTQNAIIDNKKNQFNFIDIDGRDLNPFVRYTEETYADAVAMADKLKVIEQNYFDGFQSKYNKAKHSVRKDLIEKHGKGVSMMTLIKAGDRTRTTRGNDYISKMNIRVGQYRWMASKRDPNNKVLTRITAIYPNTKNTWNKEGWDDATWNAINAENERWMAVDPNNRWKAIEFEVVKSSEKINNQKEIRLRKIISGAQSGVDMTGLEVAEESGLETGGTAATKFQQSIEGDRKVYRPELREKYNLKEGKSTRRQGKYGEYDDPYYQRTIDNAQEADGTVWFGDPNSPGGKLTLGKVAQKGKPTPLVNPTVEELKQWLIDNEIEVLNVAGNREYKNPGISDKARQILKEALKDIVKKENTKTDAEKKTSVESDIKNEQIIIGSYVQYKGQDYIVTQFNSNGTIQIYDPRKEGPAAKLSVSAKNLTPGKDTAQIVEYQHGNNSKPMKYLVTRKGNIISLETNRVMKWPENDAKRKAILKKANENKPKLQTDISDEQLASANPELQNWIQQRLAKMFPFIQVFQDRNAFNEFIKKHFGHGLDVNAIGAAISNLIFIDPNKAVQSTRVHEYAHIYWDALPEDNIIKKRLLNLTKKPGMTPAQNEEAAIILIGKEGVNIAKRLYKGAILDRIIHNLKLFWANVKNLFGMPSKEDLAVIFSDRMFRNADAITAENIVSGIVKNMLLEPKQIIGNESKEAVNEIIKFFSKDDPSFTSIKNLLPKRAIRAITKYEKTNEEYEEAGLGYSPMEKWHYMKHGTSYMQLEEVTGGHTRLIPLTKSEFYNRMNPSGIPMHIAMNNPENAKNIDEQYDAYLEDLQEVKRIWDEYFPDDESVIRSLKNKKNFKSVMRDVERMHELAAADLRAFIYDMYTKMIIYEEMMAEEAANKEYRPATEAYKSMLYGDLTPDWHNSTFVSGQMSLMSWEYVQETMLRAYEILKRKKLQEMEIKQQSIRERMDDLIKRAQKAKVNWNKIITYGKQWNKSIANGMNRPNDADGNPVKVMYFIGKPDAKNKNYNNSEYVKLKNQNTEESRILIEFIDLIKEFESEAKNNTGYGIAMRDKNGLKVPQVKADIGELVKKFGFEKGSKIYLNKKSIYDHVVIDVSKIKGFSKPMMTFEEAKQELINKYKGVKSVLLITKMEQIEMIAVKQAESNIHADGRIIGFTAADYLNIGINFEIADSSTDDIGNALMKYFNEEVRLQAMHEIKPWASFIEEYYGLSKNESIRRWVKLSNDALLYKKKPDSSLGKYAPILQGLVNYTHWLTLGFNWMTAPFNAATGFIQTIREIGIAKTLKGFWRVFHGFGFNKDFDKAYVHSTAINLLQKLQVVNTSKDAEMSISSKVAARISNVMFSHITFVEYVNHAYSFIGQLEEHEWEALKAAGPEASVTEIAKILTQERILQLKSDTQIINGGYNPWAKRGINNTVEGRAMMQFKNWMPDMFVALFGPAGSRKVYRDLAGRKRRGITWTYVDFIKIATKVFYDPKKAQTEWENLSEVDKQTLKKGMNLLIFAGGFSLAILAVAGDDNDDKTKSLRLNLGRLLGDVTYFYDMDNLEFMFKSGVPVLKTTTQLLDLVKEVGNVTFGDPSIYKNKTFNHSPGDWKLPIYIIESVPVVNKLN